MSKLLKVFHLKVLLIFIYLKKIYNFNNLLPNIIKKGKSITSNEIFNFKNCFYLSDI